MSVPTSRSAKSSSAPKHWPHQLQSKALCKTQPRVLDFADPGTGKTRVHIENFIERPGHKRLLVICPISLMQPAWGVDLNKFAPRLSVGYSTAEDRLTAFQSGCDVVILNTDGVKWLLDVVEGTKRPKRAGVPLLKDFDHLVIDEIAYFKHPNSQRSKAMRALAKHFKYRYGMTGTPNPNSVTELWHQALIIDDGKRLGMSFFHFRNATQNAEQVGPQANHLKWRDKPGAEEAAFMLLKDIVIRHDFETVMTHVPPNYRRTYELDIPKRLRTIYEKFQREAFVLLENGGVISTAQAGAVRQKLLQICSGAVYATTDDDADYQVLDTTRYELTADLIESRKHSIAFFNWRHQRVQLENELRKRGVEYAMIDGTVKVETRNDIVRDFESGNLQGVIMHYKTGAHGLTLTRGDSCFFTSPIYEADYFKQGIHRIYRGAQDKPTNTITMEARDTVEQDVYAQLFDKGTRMKSFLDLLVERSHG